MNSGRYAAKIRKNIADGQNFGVNGTPTFFLGYHPSGSMTTKVVSVIRGAQPYAQFKDAIEKALREIAGN
jgi:protein-disulfide isomerase